MSGINELLGSIKAYKGHFTRTITEADRLAAFAKTHSSSFIAAELEKCHQTLQKYAGIMEEKYVECQIADIDNYKEYESRITALGKDYTKASDALLQVIANVKAAPTTAPTAAPQAHPGAAKVKANDSLKPFQLTLEHTPVELRAWTKQFRAFYSTSGLDKCTIPEQQAYLRVCIHANLEARLQDQVDEHTAIFGDDGYISLIEKEFLSKYPIFARRLDFFRFQQATNQPFTEFATKLRAKGDEADLAALTTEQLYIFRYIGGCSDHKLKEKFLKVETPSLLEMDRIARAYEVANLTMKAIEQPTKANKTYQKMKGQKDGKPDQNADQRSALKQSLKGKCFRCGKGNHKSEQCYKKDNVCSKCHRQGHMPNVCLTTAGNSRAQSTNPSRQQSRAPSRPPSPQASSTKQASTRTGQPTSSTAYVSHARTIHAKRGSHPTPRLQLELSHPSCRSFIQETTPDTGATRTIVALNILKKNNIPIRKASETLYAANGNTMDCAGTVTLNANAGLATTPMDCIVSGDVHDDILVSWHDLQALGVIPGTFPNVSRAIGTGQDTLEIIAQDYPDVLNDDLQHRSISGAPMHIYLKDDVAIKPRKVLTARQIPVHWQHTAQEVIQKALDNGVLEPVAGPTDWISPAFFVPKEGGKGGLRLVTDYTALNKYVKRPVHPFPSSLDIIRAIKPDSSYFAKLDAVQGYFQIPLDEESSLLTTFLLPSGRYKYKRAPMGLNASSDEWCQRSDAALQGLEGVTKLVDDILIQAPDEATLHSRIRQVLDRCKAHGITISKKKLQIGQEVKFAGFLVTPKGIQPDPEKTKAIKCFPTPTDITSLRSFLGLANQLGHFIPDLAHTTERVRQLLQKDTAFTWLDEHQQDFEKVKTLLTSNLVVQHFDTNAPTELLTDASRLKGLGYALIQRSATGETQLIECGSRSLTPTESRYATIELELLAIAWAMEKCHYYLMGHKGFKVITDHRPLLGIFGKDLGELSNPRLQRIREKLAPFSFDIEWTSGKTHLIADALSRAPCFSPPEEPEDTSNTCNAVLDSHLPLRPLLEAAADRNYQEVINAIRNGKTNLTLLPPSHPAQAYSNVWLHLSLLDDSHDTLIVYDGTRIVVPPSARQEILRLLHLPHQGVVKTRKAAQQAYYWPGMNNDIKAMISKCTSCQTLLPSLPKEPLIGSEAETPMHKVSVDLFENAGHHYLIMVDRFSGYPFYTLLRSLNTESVTKHLTAWFQEYGYPTVIRSDGGPQFRHSFNEFCKENAITHELTAPYNSQSNGLAEAAVKSIKFLLQKCQMENSPFPIAFSEWKRMPRADGYSPADMFFGRHIRGLLPMLPQLAVDLQDAHARREDTLQCNRDRAGGHDLPPLQVGDRVRVQNHVSGQWDATGTVVSLRDNGRSYVVDIDNARSSIRNRRHLRPIPTHAPAGVDNQIAEQGKNCIVPILRRSERLQNKTADKHVQFAI